MTDVTENQSQSLEDMDVDEMTPEQREQVEKTMLRERLTQMGVRYSNNAGVEALREKLRVATEDGPAAVNAAEEVLEVVDPTPSTSKAQPAFDAVVPELPNTRAQTKAELRNQLRREQMKLVRLRITNLDPKKKEWPGEILTVANEYIGTVSRFVPFGEATDEGWHVEQCLYEMMKERQFLDVITKKVQGQIIVSHRLVREFSLEVLPQLTQNELTKLGQAQLAAGTSTLD